MSFSYTTLPRNPAAGFYSPSRTYLYYTDYGGDNYVAEQKHFSRSTSGGYYATVSPPYPKMRYQYSHYVYRMSSYESNKDSDYEDFEYEYIEDRNGRVYLCRVPIRPIYTAPIYDGISPDKYYQSQKYGENPEPSPYSARRQSSAASTPQRPPPRPTTTRPMATPKNRPPEAPPKATEADARKHHIPLGYSFKNWDPTEEPILLLGSVFDANSLGKWIYDWTVYHHGPATPLSDIAGELWLSLIQLAGKIKRAEEGMLRIRRLEDKEIVNDFILSGERLTDKLKALLKICEASILKAGRKGSSKTTIQLGKNTATDFVDSIFGRDRQLDATEKFMASIRLWNMRFDVNCEDILRRPGQSRK
ncbi:vegetative cell wall gp1 protein [Rutstroemia sp. NJR-2017a BBW]|nr:vegetative cell wall gp1 protein [Rutstroemia sp. NJR-2017a BBW]